MDLTTSPGPGPALGMIGLGRMGANLVRRLVAGGGTAAVFDTDPAVAVALAEELGAAVTPAATLDELVGALAGPRAVWVMVPASVAGTVVGQVAALLSPGDVVIDGGNTDWREDAPRAGQLAEAGIALLDVGTSGGVWGLERGYCMMVGGPDESVARLAPILDVLAPPTTEEHGPGWGHMGPVGSGHYVKMVHNGVEYALMQAYAEGFNLFDACEYELDNAKIAHLWVRSWLCELAALAFEQEGNDRGELEPVVADAGEGRWTLEDATDKRVPVPTIAMSLFERYASQSHADFANKVNAALRAQFGGHPVERKD